MLEEIFYDEKNGEGTRRTVYKSNEDFGEFGDGSANGQNNNAGVYSETEALEGVRTVDGREPSETPGNGQRGPDLGNRGKGLGDSFQEITGKTSLDLKTPDATEEQASLLSDVQDSVRTAVREELNRMGEEYGWIPRGEKAAREVWIPKKTAEDKYVSQTALGWALYNNAVNSGDTATAMRRRKVSPCGRCIRCSCFCTISKEGARIYCAVKFCFFIIIAIFDVYIDKKREYVIIGIE